MGHTQLFPVGPGVHTVRAEIDFRASPVIHLKVGDGEDRHLTLQDRYPAMNDPHILIHLRRYLRLDEQ